MELKVTLITPALPSRGRTFFPGVERYAEGLLQALKSKGMRLHVITSFWNGGNLPTEFHGIEVTRVPDSSISLGRAGRILDLHFYTFGRNLIKRTWDILKSSDIVHTLMPLSCAGTIASLRPLVAQFHHPKSFDAPIDLLYLPLHRLIEWVTYRNADLILAHSVFGSQKVAENFRIPPSRVRVGYCGIDSTRFSPSEKSAHAQFRLLSVGILERRKAFDQLLKALGIILSRGKGHPELTIIGDGPDRMRLKHLADDLGIESAVRFAGFVTEGELLSHYQRADAFVFPSYMEGFGIAIAEAMACGVPVIACNASAVPEVVGDAGILVPPNDFHALAEAIVRIMEDEDLRKRLGELGVQRVRTLFTWDMVAERVRRAYDLALNMHLGSGETYREAALRA